MWKIHCKPFRGGRWHAIADLPEVDGTNDDVLTINKINEECLIYLISQAEQPPLLNVKMVKKSDVDSMTLTSDDIDNDIISNSNEWWFNNIMLYLIVVSSIDK